MNIELIGEKLKAMDSYMRESNQRIESHLKTLNGRVGENVLAIGDLKQWRAWTLGFACCFTIILLPIAFLVFGRII